MPESCEPNDLSINSTCFGCLSGRQLSMVEVYLLAQIAGGLTEPEELVEAAACFDCLSDRQLSLVQTYLLCQIVNA